MTRMYRIALWAGILSLFSVLLLAPLSVARALSADDLAPRFEALFALDGESAGQEAEFAFDSVHRVSSFEVKIGNRLATDTVTNRHSAANGETVIAVPIEVTNLEGDPCSFSTYSISVCGPDGTKLTSVANYFDDSVLTSSLFGKATSVGYLHFVYVGDGTYTVVFDMSNYVEIEIPVVLDQTVDKASIALEQPLLGSVPNSVTFGATFDYDDFELTLGDRYAFRVAENRYADYDGMFAVSIPVWVTNNSSRATSVNPYGIDVYDQYGRYVDSCFSAFEDDITELGDIAPERTRLGYVDFLFKGDGLYTIYFDLWDTTVVQLEITEDGAVSFEELDAAQNSSFELADGSATFGSTFHFEDFDVEIGTTYSVTKIDSDYSSLDGAAVIAVPVTLTNTSSQVQRIDYSCVDMSAPNGVLLDSVSSYFDDSVCERGYVLSGITYSGHLYFLYEGDGTYLALFDLSDCTEVYLPIFFDEAAEYVPVVDAPFDAVEQNPANPTFGSTFEYDEFTVSLGTEFMFTEVDNRYTSLDGSRVVAVPVQITNNDAASGSFSNYDVCYVGPYGLGLEACNGHFDDGAVSSNMLLGHAVRSGYLYFLYEGDGVYTVALGGVLGGGDYCEIQLPINAADAVERAALEPVAGMVAPRVDANGYGSTFVFEDLSIVVGDTCYKGTVDSRYSSHDGEAVVILPITVTNLSTGANSINQFAVETYNPLGIETDAVYSDFDSDVREIPSLAPGETVETYLVFLYEGDGLYTTLFDLWDYCEMQVEVQYDKLESLAIE